VAAVIVVVTAAVIVVVTAAAVAGNTGDVLSRREPKGSLRFCGQCARRSFSSRGPPPLLLARALPPGGLAVALMPDTAR
jgi:hypothetical protein